MKMTREEMIKGFDEGHILCQHNDADEAMIEQANILVEEGIVIASPWGSIYPSGPHKMRIVWSVKYKPSPSADVDQLVDRV